MRPPAFSTAFQPFASQFIRSIFRSVLLSVFLVGLLAGCADGLRPTDAPPNLVVIFADDLGYGDLGVYGHPTILTPNLDQMAAEGMKFTQFYTAASVCTPSRAGLLTGRLPIRSGMASDGRRVLFPDSRLGLPAEEITIAEALRDEGYATAAIGKWHLGHLPEFLPTRHGFDTYFGIPYSNDMDRVASTAGKDIFREPVYSSWNVPLLRDEEVVEQPTDQRTITKRYTEEAVAFVRANKDKPFFVYLAHSLPHVPLFRSADFVDKSRRGLYGDVIEEIDWSVGQVLNSLREEGIAENTLVVFTSDNGPWLVYGTHGGSAGLLRGGKGMTWEGGMRVPAIAWQPGTVAAGVVQTEVASTLDLFPTALARAGIEMPGDRVIDGRNVEPLLRGDSVASPHAQYFFYRGATLFAVRQGPWKAHLQTEWAYRADSARVVRDPPLLFNLDLDPEERLNVAADHPDVVGDLLATVRRHQSELNPRPSQLDARIED